jgi:Ran GTPase-activating protein (RanGAP) involved in mRNA processing and transport
MEACAASGAVPISRFARSARAEELDVHSRGICNRGLVALSAALETNKFMVRLRISANNVDAEGFNAFLKALAQNETLESVDVSENALGSQATKTLTTVDWSALPPSVLFWTLRRCKLRASDIAGIAAALPNVPRLQLLDVSDNSCGEAALNNLMDCVGAHENIAALRLQWNSLGIGSGRAAAAMLQKASCNLQLLDLSWNHLGDSGVGELCQGLKSTATLRRLFLSHNNMTSVGCKALASVMHESGGGAADVLEELDVSYNNCRFEARGAHGLTNA